MRFMLSDELAYLALPEEVQAIATRYFQGTYPDIVKGMTGKTLEDALERAREAGGEDGYAQGEEDGRREGLEEGYDDGYADGYADGLKKGLASASEQLLTDVNAVVNHLQAPPTP